MRWGDGDTRGKGWQGALGKVRAGSAMQGRMQGEGSEQTEGASGEGG